MLKNSKLLIVGGDSQIAKILRQSLKQKKIQFSYTSRKKKKSKNVLNIDFDQIALYKLKKFLKCFDIIVYCLALKDVRYCQNNPKKSFFINFFLPYHIVKKTRSKFIFFQTNIKNNKNLNYSKDKLNLENELKKYSSRVKIITIAKFINKNHPFIKKIMILLKNNKKIHICKDKKFYITDFLDLKKKFIKFLSEKKKKLNLVSKQKYDYFTLISKYHSILGINKKKFLKLKNLK